MGAHGWAIPALKRGRVGSGHLFYGYPPKDKSPKRLYECVCMCARACVCVCVSDLRHIFFKLGYAGYSCHSDIILLLEAFTGV